MSDSVESPDASGRPSMGIGESRFIGESGFGWDGRPADVGVHPVKLGRHRRQDLVGKGLDRAQRMVGWRPCFSGPQKPASLPGDLVVRAWASPLDMVVPPCHATDVSSTFRHSVFQQPARSPRFCSRCLRLLIPEITNDTPWSCMTNRKAAWATVLSWLARNRKALA